jgi:DNA-binding LacI/PurR family transcriptional regulator
LTQQTRRPTIADVALAAGVSKTSVSFAFNTPERLRPETLTRIRHSAATLGYRPKAAMRTLGQRRHGTIAILASHALGTMFANPYFGEFAAGALAASEAAGFSVQFFSPLHGPSGHTMAAGGVAGVLAIGLRTDGPEIDDIDRAGLPLVTVDSAPAPGIPSLTVDDESGARAAADHLLGLGHRSFLILSMGPFPSQAGNPWTVRARRMAGYSSALAAHGIVLPTESVEYCHANVAEGAAAFTRSWMSGLRPTAILAMCDAMAIGALHAAREVGLRVPADLSVVGFDDIELARYTDPPLTTVRQPIHDKGREAVRLLLSSPVRREDRMDSRTELETRLVVRGSTRRVRASRHAGSARQP